MLVQSTSEYSISVRDDLQGAAVQANDVIHDHLDDLFHGVWVSQRNKVSVFHESVDYYQDHFLPIGFWEGLNEIQNDARPGCARDVQWLQ
jgi:hypothetical protein